jgi:hypothetical protein
LLIARFTAESQCTQQGGGENRFCLIRIIARKNNTTEALQPEDPRDFAFDSTNDNREQDGSWESHAVDRSIQVGPGTWVVGVQYRVSKPGTTFRLDDWHLTVMRSVID